MMNNEKQEREQKQKFEGDELVKAAKSLVTPHGEGEALEEFLVEVPPIESLSKEQIQEIRTKHRMSQPVFAHLLNVTVDTVKSWETGRREPGGAALKLLNVAKHNGFAVFGSFASGDDFSKRRLCLVNRIFRYAGGFQGTSPKSYYDNRTGGARRFHFNLSRTRRRSNTRKYDGTLFRKQKSAERGDLKRWAEIMK